MITLPGLRSTSETPPTADDINSVLHLFLECPRDSLIVVRDPATKKEFEARLAHVHHENVVVCGDLKRLIGLPPSTRVLLYRIKKVYPEFVSLVGQCYQIVLSV